MAKPKKIYKCKNCGHSQPTWVGICPECGEAGSFVEETIAAQRAGSSVQLVSSEPAAFIDLAQVGNEKFERFSTGISELDRVLGGGLVKGSYLVIGGEPGAGKTTMASETLINLSREGKDVAYVSGEESAAQLGMRFERLGAKKGEDKLSLSSEVGIERICQSIRDNSFDLIVIDSIQTMISEGVPGSPGSVSQVKECAHQLMRAAKGTGTSVLVIGQVVKSGDIAGPNTLRHLVDVVLAFEGDRQENYRILRAVKNRFGADDEIGVFEMTATGLKGIADPSALFMEETDRLPGSALTAVVEGSRPVLCEIQALAATSNLPQPIRSVRGLNRDRTQMLLAVLSRKAGIHLGSLDIHINVSGGLKVDDPGTDLAVCLAVASAVKGAPLKESYCSFGEVSLLGQTRPASQNDRRAKEAERLGHMPLASENRRLRDIISSSLGAPIEESLSIAD